MEEIERKPTISAQLYAIDKQYKDKIDFVATIEEDEKYINGVQWPENNKYNQIRITMNFIAYAIRTIASKINGTPLHLTYVSSNDKFDGSKLSRYDSFVRAKLGHEAFSLQCAVTGENLGTAIVYMNWDAEAPYTCGGFFEGGLQEQLIDPRNFAVENPHQPSIQRQKWVMIWQDIYAGELEDILRQQPLSKQELYKRIALLRQDARAKSNLPDDQNPDKLILNSTLVRTYFRFFRIKGEVCYTMETENVSLFAYPKPLSKLADEALAKKVQEEYEKRVKEPKEPKINKYGVEEGYFQYDLVEDLKIDYENTIASAEAKALGESDKKRYRETFSLYPFALFVPKVQNGCIYGRSMTKELIPVQNGYNYAYSLSLKALENISFDKVYGRKGALARGEVFRTDPEHNFQPDNYTGNGNGFYKLGVASIPGEVMKLPELLLDAAKGSYNFNDFANGEMANQETSGYAVSIMLRQANAPLEQEQKLFWQFQVELAQIRLMFYKHYIDSREYTYEMTQAEYDEEERARMTVLNSYRNGRPMTDARGNEIPFEIINKRFGKPTKRHVIQQIKGSELFGIDFDIKIVAQQGLVESQLSTQQWYTQMLANGGIANFEQNPMMLEFAIKSAEGIIPEDKRAAMQSYVEAMKHSRIRQLEQQVAMLVEQNKQLIAAGQSQEEQFRNAINVARTQVDNANKERKQMAQTLAAYGIDEGQVHSNNAKGISAPEQVQMAKQPTM